MNSIYTGIFQALFPGIIAALEGLFAHAQQHAADGNHDAAHATLAAVAGIAQVATQVAGEVMPSALGVVMPAPAEVAKN